MPSPSPVSLASLGISNEDLELPVGDIKVDLDESAAVLLVLRESVRHLRPAAKSQLLHDLGIPAEPDAKTDLSALSAVAVSDALFSAFLAESVLVALEDALPPAAPAAADEPPPAA